MRRNLVIVIVLVLIVAAGIAWRTCGSRDTSRGASSSSTKQSQSSAAAGGERATTPKPPPSPASLSGRVTRASDGAGIAGAIVSIAPAEVMAMIMKSDSPTVIAVTGADGAWQARINPGALAITATAIGFLPAPRMKLVLAGGEQRSGIDLALAAGGTLVKGTVTDVGGGPIGDARITVVEDGIPDLSGQLDYVATTKSDGTYEITLPDGELRAGASHDDYASVSRDIVVEGKPLTVDFELIPGSTIRGQVVSRDDNKPVAGALVRAEGGRRGRGGGGDSMVRSDGDGNFVVRGLGSGTISLFALARGYSSTNPTEIAVGIGEQVDGVKLVVDRAFSIAGRVVKKGRQEEGVAGITLGAFSIANQAFGMALEPSAKDGAFEIVGLRPASYMLFAVGDGSVPEVGKNVDVVDKDVTGVVVEMTTGVTLSGRVDPPIGKVEMSLELAGSIGLANMFEAAKTFLVHGETDEAGTFTLRNAPAGSFNVVGNAPGGEQGKVAVTVGEVDVANLVVKLEARAAISGRVVDTNGAVVAGAHVSATAVKPDAKPSFSFRGGGDGNVVTAADGTYRIVGIESGKVTMMASVDRQDMWMRRMDKDHKPLEIEVVAGKEKTGVNLTVEARDGVIRGTVLGPDRQPAGDAWVTATLTEGGDDKLAKLRGRFGGSKPVLTSGDGTFAIKKLRRGTYELVVEGPRGGTRATKEGVKTGDSVTIVLASLGTLAGKVTLDNAPVSAFDIACDGPTDKRRSVTSADGTYSLGGLAPGKYECTIDSADGSTSEKDIEVPAGPLDKNFALRRWATITGVVVNVLTKQPIAGVFAFAGQRDKNVAELLTGRAPVTDKSGRFVVPRVAAGKGELVIQGKEGFTPLAKREYTVTEGQRLDIGTIEIVAPRTGDPGTFGMVTTPGEDHLVVSHVAPDGPALAAGVKEGDKIKSLDGIPVAKLTPVIAKTLLESGVVGVGVPVRLGIDRAGAPLDVAVVSVKW